MIYVMLCNSVEFGSGIGFLSQRNTRNGGGVRWGGWGVGGGARMSLELKKERGLINWHQFLLLFTFCYGWHLIIFLRRKEDI